MKALDKQKQHLFPKSDLKESLGMSLNAKLKFRC